MPDPGETCKYLQGRRAVKETTNFAHIEADALALLHWALAHGTLPGVQHG